jgi:hypothetical protein
MIRGKKRLEDLTHDLGKSTEEVEETGAKVSCAR